MYIINFSYINNQNKFIIYKSDLINLNKITFEKF